MKKYTTTGCRSVMAESMSAAAEIFAGRMARKKYGKTGYCRTLRQDGIAMDGSFAEYESFIGYSVGHGQTVGRNVRFSVSQ